MSLFFCRYDDPVPSRGEINLADFLPQAFARIPPLQRREAACAQGSVKGMRTGCCNLDCKIVSSRTRKEEAEAPLLRCSKCVAVSYCCRGCQREAWGEHQKLCGHLVLCKNAERGYGSGRGVDG